MKIAIVAGELSGDLLGAGLIAALRKRYPSAHFQGVGGARMLAEGFESYFPMDSLSVMGLVEVLRHLPRLLHIQKSLRRRFSTAPPDVFIGIDLPDFNLPLEAYLKRQSVPTVHYVSPTIWAWRQRRVHKIARAVDLMLTLFPFEAEIYRKHSVAVQYVGHPLADEIPLVSDRNAARRKLALPSGRTLVALLPGSRITEVKALGPLFIKTARWLQAKKPELSFIIPLATPSIRNHMTALVTELASDLDIILVDGHSREVMAAANVILLASGTATLEALLLKRPMVVAYSMASLTFFMATRLVKLSHFSIPNLLAGQELVTEFIQDKATVANLGPAVLALLDNPAIYSRLNAQFEHIHHQLRRNASQQAALAIAKLLNTT